MEQAERRLTLSYLARARYEDSLDLRQLYPVSPFYVLQSFLLLAGTLVVTALVLSTDNALSKLFHPHDLVGMVLRSPFGPQAEKLLAVFGDSVSMLAFAALVATLMLALSFLLFSRRRYQYRVDSGVLEVSKGVFVREKQTIVLAEVSDVFVQRSMLDHLFGIADVVLCLPGIIGDRTVRIKGLAMPDALAVEECLSGLIGGRRSEERLRLAGNQ